MNPLPPLVADLLPALGTLAYRPFIDPINMQRTWHLLLLPLCFLIAVAYKAIRVPDLTKFWGEVFKFTTQLVLAVIIVGAASFAVVELVLPAVLPMD